MNEPNTQTKSLEQAFCKACKKGVELPHECPKTQEILVKIPGHRGGM